MDARPDDLAQVPGLGDNSVTLLKLIRDANVRYLARTLESLPLLDSPQLFADYARMKLGGRDCEITLVFYLNTQNRLIRCDTLGSGSVDAVSIFPSEKAEKVMAILEENIRTYRGELGRKVGKQLRIVPELVFYLDTTLDYAEHIDELLKK